MCSPTIMAKVSQEITRRGLLRNSGIAGVAALAAAGGLRRRAHAQEASPVASASAGSASIAFPAFSQIFDLTHVWGPNFPVYFGAASPEFEVLSTVESGGYYKNLLRYDEHVGTHMDSPAHFVADGVTADRLPIESLFAPLVVIDIAARAAEDPDAQGTPDDIIAWESTHGPIPAGAFVALNSGWDATLATPGGFINLDANNVQHYPGWHPEAAALLVGEREIVGAGVDTASLDFGMSTDFGSHLTLLPAGKYGIEGLANLGSLPASGASIIVGGPKHVAASGGPARVFAVV